MFDVHLSIRRSMLDVRLSIRPSTLDVQCSMFKRSLFDRNLNQGYSIDMKFTKHFKQMIKEREISTNWVEQTVNSPHRIEEPEDGTQHYLKQIPENGNRWLRVVVNVKSSPNRAITAFFDRRLWRKKYENKSR